MSRSLSALVRTLLLAAAVALGACKSKGPPPAIDDFHASTGTIDKGGSTWLYFKATGATSLSIDNGIGDVIGRTAMPAGPEVTTTYTLTASNPAGSVTATATLTVLPLAAQLTAFTATPDSVVAGKPVTLKWNAVDAVSLQLSASPAPPTPLPAPTLQSTQVSVSPSVSTVYTLTAVGPDGTRQPAPRSVAVVVGQLPAVALNTDSTSVARGAAASLSWSSSVAATFTLVSRPHDAQTPVTRLSLGTVTQAQVRPVADTDYTIEALGPAGTATSNAVAVAVSGALATTLHYLDPIPGSADVAALRLRALTEGGAVAIFDLVALAPITAGALALELPLDGSTPGSREGGVRVALDGAEAGDVTPGLVANPAAIDPGASPAAAIAALPKTGPSAGLLMLAVARKPVCQGLSCAGGVPADSALAAGTVLASVRLRLQPEGGAGPVFTAGALDAAHGARSVVRSGAGGTSLGTIAAGSLSAQ